jgi:hypothetical protein
VPWYLQTKFHVPDAIAFEHSSSGGEEKRKNWDFGLDGYHLIGEPYPTSLLLIQAKFSDSVTYIAKGFGDFLRLLNFLSNALAGKDVDVPQENHVLFNLRGDLKRLDSSVLGKLELDFRVIHLSDLDKEILIHRTEASRSKLKDEIRKQLRDHISEVDILGPKDMGEMREIIVPQAKYALSVRFLNPYDTEMGAKMYFGMAKLADFVRMYESRREELFSKNIRYYIKSTKNTGSGPAGRIKETLGEICIKKANGSYEESPHMFAALHNGISLYTSGVDLPRPNGEGLPVGTGTAMVSEPYVINGCQTIKSAYYFRGEKEDLVDVNRWEQIEVPIRVIETADVGIVRTVTLSNNFQNAVSYSALHANDEDQIELQRRFEERGIFYQRQDGAFDSLVKDRPDQLQEKYANTNGSYIDIVKLAQAIMAAAGQVAYAKSPSDIFEIRTAYDRCFSKEKTRSITLLVFLANLYKIMPTILKKDMELMGLKWKDGSSVGPPPSRFVNQAFCLFVRYLAREGMDDTIQKFGDKVYPGDELREEIARMMRRGPGLKKVLASWMKELDEALKKGARLNELFEQAKRDLRLGDNVNPFEKFRDL